MCGPDWFGLILLGTTWATTPTYNYCITTYFFFRYITPGPVASEYVGAEADPIYADESTLLAKGSSNRTDHIIFFQFITKCIATMPFDRA